MVVRTVARSRSRLIAAIGGVFIIAAASFWGSGRAAATPPRAPYEGTRVYAYPGQPLYGGIVLDAGDLDNSILVRIDDARGEFVITDKAGAKVDRRQPQYASRCNEISETRVRCPVYEPGGVNAGLGGGRDTLEVDTTRQGPIAVYGHPGDDRIQVSNQRDADVAEIYGGAGDDLILGGPAFDAQYGGPGDDVLRGRGGDDRLWGERGADTVSGGPNSDWLRVADSDQDRSIRCGSGDDRATVDRQRDPRPAACEMLDRR